MANYKSLNLVEEYVSPILEQNNYWFVDCDIKKIAGNVTLTVYIDSDSGITLNDCEKVSKLLEDGIDELNVTNDVAYHLSISSPGLDRPLKKDLDYKRNLNKKIEIKFFDKDKYGAKNLEGKLMSYNSDSFVIEVLPVVAKKGAKITNPIKLENQQLEIKKEHCANIVPIIEF